MLLYQEFLKTQPWDTLLALAVIGVVVAVPIIVSLGLRIQERRSEEERPIAWLKVIPRDASRGEGTNADARVNGDGASSLMEPRDTGASRRS